MRVIWDAEKEVTKAFLRVQSRRVFLVEDKNEHRRSEVGVSFGLSGTSANFSAWWSKRINVCEATVLSHVGKASCTLFLGLAGNLVAQLEKF